MSKKTQEICKECAASGKGCCNRRDDGTYTPGITASDMMRIARATGTKPSKWAAIEEMVPEAYESISASIPGIARMYPVWNGKPMRISLRFDGKDGACYFLGPRGCRLDRNQRPRVCSLFPAWYFVDGESIVIDPSGIGEGECIALEKTGGKRSELLKILGSSDAQLLDLARASELETRKYAEMTEDEVKEIYNGDFLF